VILGLSKSQQEEFTKEIEASNKSLNKTFEDTTNELKGTSSKVAIAETKLQAAGAESVESIPGSTAATLKTALDTYLTTLEDGIIPSSGSAPIILKKGAIYKGLKTDDVAVGEGLGSALSNVSGGNVGGNIDININLNGSIAGDPGQLNKMFNSPEVQKQIMDTVLYKLNDYKRQQGVLS
jgi:hypothetical protein